MIPREFSDFLVEVGIVAFGGVLRHKHTDTVVIVLRHGEVGIEHRPYFVRLPPCGHCLADDSPIERLLPLPVVALGCMVTEEVAGIVEDVILRR